MTETQMFACSICAESSSDICVYCTKDACANHLCERCHRCSDCCECNVRRQAPGEEIHAAKLDTPQPELVSGAAIDAIEEPIA
ncbi:MAG: hypothetical protein ABI165_14690 [Bryobacteraceae bacterium]